MRNLQEQVKKALCYQKIVPTFLCLNKFFQWSQNFANSRPSASNFKSFSRSLENFGNKIPIPQKVPLNLIVKIDETWTATWLQFFWILVVWESEFDFSRLFSFFFQYFIILEWYNIPFFLWPDVTFDLVSNPYAHSFHLKLFWKINSFLHF